MEIIRGRLTAKDYSNPSLRYNEGTDTVEFTPDGGVTWTPAPSADPRHSDLFRLPALETADPRCDAAANMVKWMKDFIDSMTELLGAGAIAFTLINTAIELMSTVFPPDLFVLPITEACEILFGIGSTALLAAFDSDTYDALLCAFYCNLEPDGTVTAADLVKMETQVTDTLNTTAALVVNLLFVLQGEVGVSNAGVIGGQTGDCTDCACLFHYCFEFLTSDQAAAGWAAVAPYGTWNSGSGWRTVAGQGLILQCDLPTDAEVVHIGYDGTFFSGGGPNVWGIFWRFGGSNLHVDSGALSGVPYSVSADGDYTIDQIWLNPSGGSSADIYIQNCYISSKTEIPAWSAFLC